jgi:hypothetical protein
MNFNHVESGDCGPSRSIPELLHNSGQFLDCQG